jgi:hypothetical protein
MNFRNVLGMAPVHREAVADASAKFVVIFFIVEETVILGFLNPANLLIYQYLPINKIPHTRRFKFSATEP